MSASSAPVRRVERLTGPEAVAARTRALQTNSKFARAQARSAARHRARGHKPTEVTAAFRFLSGRTTSPTSLLEQIGAAILPTLRAQYAEVEDGYGFIYSWDDENNETWEGNVYVVSTSNGRSGNFDAQLLTTTAGGEAVPEILWYGGDLEGGPEDEEEEPIEISDLVSGRGVGFGLMRLASSSAASRREDCPCVLLLTGDMASCMIAEALEDAWPYCVGAAVGCTLSGPFYWECVSAACVTAAVANFIEEMNDVWNRCIAEAPADKETRLATRDMRACLLERRES